MPPENTYQRLSQGYQPGPDGGSSSPSPPPSAPYAIIRPDGWVPPDPNQPAPDEHLTKSEVPIPADLAGEDPVVIDLHQEIVSKQLDAVTAIKRAAQHERYQCLVYVVMLGRLCNDERDRGSPRHKLLHRALGLRPDEHVGQDYVEQTRVALGIDPFTAETLVREVDEQDRLVAGLVGHGPGSP